MKNRIIGYIVSCTFTSDRSARQLMELDTNEEGSLVLYFGDTATFFDTYEHARGAIRRTMREFNARKFPDGTPWNFQKQFGQPQIRALTQPIVERPQKRRAG